MTKKIAVIGAGVSASSFSLSSSRYADLHLFEKSRGLGGRLSYRKVEGIGEFDHGAQFFTARSQSFRSLVGSLELASFVEVWRSKIVMLDAKSKSIERAYDSDRYISTPSANSLIKGILEPVREKLNIEFETRVSQVEKEDTNWHLFDENKKSLGKFDVLISSAPAPQSLELLADYLPASLTELLESSAMQPCWALMLELNTQENLGFDAAFVKSSPIAWMARNDNKRAGQPENKTRQLWVLHTNPDWAKRFSKNQQEEVIEQLSESFVEIWGRPVEITWKQVHYWKYALAAKAVGGLSFYDDSQQLGLCGDYFPGDRIEGAFLSGEDLAGKVLRS